MSAIHAPAGFDLHGHLLRLNSSALEHSSQYRRAICRVSPVTFALVYLVHHLRSDETGGRISLSQFHIDIAAGAERWIRDDFGPAELREAWIAPRGAAKSTWLFLILPCWALAFGHQRFIMAFSDSGAQARGHLASLKRELEQNELLRADFPELCEPTTTRGNRRTSDNAELYVAKSGVAMAAKGIDSSTLGAKIGNQRPTLLLLDDIEPAGADYDAGMKDKRLDSIVNKVFPMATNAVVQWAGTTTAFGSLTHDLVKAATGQESAVWIGEQAIRPRYYPAIVTGDDGSESSLWPERWSLEWLQSIRHTRNYQLNYANQPVSASGTYWERHHMTYLPEFPIHDGVLSVDPAVTHGASSDFTGLAVVAADVGHQRVSVQSAEQARLSPAALRARVVRLLEMNDWISEVILESNQGGDVWKDILGRLPRNVRLTLYRSTAPKHARYAESLDWFERGWVSLRRSLPAFENQALAYPGVLNDDVLDAVTAGVAHWLRARVR